MSKHQPGDQLSLSTGSETTGLPRRGTGQTAAPAMPPAVAKANRATDARETRQHVVCGGKHEEGQERRAPKDKDDQNETWI